jgi:hypothetical protein
MRWCRSQKPAKSAASVVPVAAGCHPGVQSVTQKSSIGSWLLYRGIEFAQPNVYGVRMSRLMCLSIAAVLALLSVVATAAPVHKRPASHWRGYGFLPGYQQPLNNSLPLYDQKNAMRRLAKQERRPWYIDRVPRYYGYDDAWHYFGQPGFYRGHYNGGTFGPCWTRTPIGAVWNCG